MNPYYYSISPRLLVVPQMREPEPTEPFDGSDIAKYMDERIGQRLYHLAKDGWDAHLKTLTPIEISGPDISVWKWFEKEAWREQKQVLDPVRVAWVDADDETYEIFDVTRIIAVPVTPQESGKEGCPVCGGSLVEIRAKYPGGEKRKVCPTCLQERIDQIEQIASRDFGKTFQALTPTSK